MQLHIETVVNKPQVQAISYSETDSDDDIIIYLLTAIGLSPGGSTHLHTNNTDNNTNNK
jgi:hypothetical protein